MEVSKVVIDLPEKRRITKASGVINGWFAVREQQDIPEELAFRVGPIPLPHHILKRPDVEGAMPGHAIVGFQIQFDLSNYLLYIQDSRLVIQAAVSGRSLKADSAPAVGCYISDLE